MAPGPPEQGQNAPTVTLPLPAPGAGMMRRPSACPATGQSSGRKGPRARGPFAAPGRAASRPTRPGLQRVWQSNRHHPRPRWNGVATARGVLQMVCAGGQRRSLAPRCPVLSFHEPVLVGRPALRRHRHFPPLKAGTTNAPLLVVKCAAGIVASPQGRGNRRSVGTPWKASLHRTRWNASLQGRTAWQPSLPLEEGAACVQSGGTTFGGADRFDPVFVPVHLQRCEPACAGYPFRWFILAVRVRPIGPGDCR